MRSRLFTTLFILMFLNISSFAQEVVQSVESPIDKSFDDKFFGIKLRPEIWTIIKEIERKTGNKFFAEFIELEEFQFGSSYISEDGIPVVLIADKLQNGDEKKLEAVVAHELLHLRLRVNNFPTFLFSPTVNTAKGRAVDTEQSTVNDLLSIIEHRTFKPEMERLGLLKYINLAGDKARTSKEKKREAESEGDSIDYARAILEYPNQKDIDEVAGIYRENKWTRALASGKIIADYIIQTNPRTPSAVEAVFLKCMIELYQPPSTHTFKFTPDPQNKVFRRLLIGTTRKTVQKKSR